MPTPPPVGAVVKPEKKEKTAKKEAVPSKATFHRGSKKRTVKPSVAAEGSSSSNKKARVGHEVEDARHEQLAQGLRNIEAERFSEREGDMGPAEREENVGLADRAEDIGHRDALEWFKGHSLLWVPLEARPDQHGKFKGKHSYTLSDSEGAKVEILLRHKAFFVKKCRPGAVGPTGQISVSKYLKNRLRLKINYLGKSLNFNFFS